MILSSVPESVVVAATLPDDGDDAGAELGREPQAPDAFGTWVSGLESLASLGVQPGILDQGEIIGVAPPSGIASINLTLMLASDASGSSEGKAVVGHQVAPPAVGPVLATPRGRDDSAPSVIVGFEARLPSPVARGPDTPLGPARIEPDPLPKPTAPGPMPDAVRPATLQVPRSEISAVADAAAPRVAGQAMMAADAVDARRADTSAQVPKTSPESMQLQSPGGHLAAPEVRSKNEVAILPWQSPTLRPTGPDTATAEGLNLAAMPMKTAAVGNPLSVPSGRSDADLARIPPANKSRIPGQEPSISGERSSTARQSAMPVTPPVTSSPTVEGLPETDPSRPSRRERASDSVQMALGDKPPGTRSAEKVSLAAIPDSGRPMTAEWVAQSNTVDMWDADRILATRPIDAPSATERIGISGASDRGLIGNFQMTAEIARGVGAQIVEAVTRGGSGPVEISLSPEELGRVRMTLAAGDAGIVLNVTAERADTLDLMRRNIDQLAHEFRSLGYVNLSFSFTHHGSGEGSPPPQPDADDISVLPTAPPSGSATSVRLPDATDPSRLAGLDLRL